MHGNPLADIRYVFLDTVNPGDTIIVPPQGSNVKIRVLSALVVMSGAVGVRFTGTASGNLSAQFPVLANGGFVLPLNTYGWLETAPNEGLNVNLSSGTAGGVQVCWYPIKAAL